MRAYNTLTAQARAGTAGPGAYTCPRADLSGLRAL